MKYSHSIRLAALLLVIVSLLSGCSLATGDALYALPKASSDYENLQINLTELLNNGLEYAPPLSGANTQSVQLQDLNNDGQDEAIAFFRSTSSEDSSLKIYVFTQNADGSYNIVSVITGEGSDISSVVYGDLNGDDIQEIIVCWQITVGVYALSVCSPYLYSDADNSAHALLNIASFSRYVVQDMDQDGQNELVVLQLAAGDEGISQADYYNWSEEDTALTLVNSCPLSASLVSISKLEYSNLSDNSPALFLTGPTGENNTLTDILSVRDSSLTNITLDTETGCSPSYAVSIADPQDINSDSIMEVPVPVRLVSSARLNSTESFYFLQWYQYDLSGEAVQVCTTYHNATDGWYFIIPDHWVGSVALQRSDVISGSTIERGIVFYYCPDNGSEPQPFMAIYQNTGSNREKRAIMGNRESFYSTTHVTYAVEFFDCDWYDGMTTARVSERFSVISTDWSV